MYSRHRARAPDGHLGGVYDQSLHVASGLVPRIFPLRDVRDVFPGAGDLVWGQDVGPEGEDFSGVQRGVSAGAASDCGPAAGSDDGVWILPFGPETEEGGTGVAL